MTKVKRTDSCSSLNEILFSNENFEKHIFLLMGEGHQYYYGVCVIKPEFINLTPSFFDDPVKLTPNQKKYLSAPRCYCILTKFPFFSINFFSYFYFFLIFILL